MLGGNARTEWESDRFAKEDREPEHELVFGPRCRSPICWPRTRARTSAGTSGEASRFGQYAHRLWDGLLAAEVVSDQ